MKKVLFDLDETIVLSENIKKIAWTDILRLWGFSWDIERELVCVPPDMRPPTGVSPHDFIGQLIRNLNLLEASFTDRDDIIQQVPEAYRQQVVQALGVQGDKNSYEALIRVMQQEWTRSLVQEAADMGARGEIEAVPGVVESIRKLHNEGFHIGIVTQAPYEYARIVLQSLGLIEKRADLSQDRLLIEGENAVDVVVSGEMVHRPKPDPEALLTASYLIERRQHIINTSPTLDDAVDRGDREIADITSVCIPSDIPLPWAIVGDSRSDIAAGKSLGIKTILINSRMLPGREIQTMLPDLVITHYPELTPSRIELLAGETGRSTGKER